MGNWGVHILDDVRNIVFRDSVTTPTRVLATGGRVAWDNAGNTPNVHYTYFDTGKIPTLIALSNLPKAPGTKPGWNSKAGRAVWGPSTGYVVVCEGGYYLGHRGGGKAVDKNGKLIRSFKGGSMSSLHYHNFIDAIRSRDYMSLNAEIENGHHSTGWCNLANIGYRMGASIPESRAIDVNINTEAWSLILQEMKKQLSTFGVDKTDDAIYKGLLLTHNPKTERFVGEHADIANQFLRRDYRGGFVVPNEV